MAIPSCFNPRSWPRICAGLARTIYRRYTWQGNHKLYGHIQCIFMVLANPTYAQCIANKSIQVALCPNRFKLRCLGGLQCAFLSL